MAASAALVLTGTTLLAIGTSPATAVSPGQSRIACGDVVTQSVTLHHDLPCGFTISAPFSTPPIVVDLGGQHAGIVTGCGDFVVENGSIAGSDSGATPGCQGSVRVFERLTITGGGYFCVGCFDTFRADHLDGVAFGGDQTDFDFENNVMRGSSFSAVETDITMFGNTITGAGTAVHVDTGAARVSIRGNLFKGNAIGVQLGEGVAGDISGNRFVSNAGDAIELGPGTGGCCGAPVSVSNNLLLRNGGDGILVGPLPDASQCSFGAFAVTLTGNIALANGRLGIESVPNGPIAVCDNEVSATVTDGGGNRASGNGNPAQCVNVVCTPFTGKYVVTVSSATGSLVVGRPLTLSAAVTAVANHDGPPAGTFRFLDGTKLLGAQWSITGVAFVTTAKLKLGTHAITATFTKLGGTKAVSSAVLTEEVDPAP